MSLTTLPALPVGGKVTQQVLQQLPERSSQTSRSYKKFQGSAKKTPSTVESEINKSASLKGYIDTARYRYTPKHNLCLDMLQEGFHEAFGQLFNLLQKNKELTEIVGENPDDIPVLIEEDLEKVETLRKHLTAAEASKRRGRMDAVYEAQLALANYFNITGDKWLADHFYMCCLETSLVLHGDNRRKEAEAHCNLGLAAEKRDDLGKAVELLEKFYDLSADKSWETSDGQTLFQQACDSLRRVYTRVADEVENEDPEQSIQFLIKAYEMAKESEYQTEIARSGYLLGNAYEKHGDPQTAILYHKSFLETCKNIEDKKGIGEACQALSRAYQRFEDTDHATEYLELYIEVSEELGDLAAQESAYGEMGALYDRLGRYQEASQYFSKAYAKAKAINDNTLADQARLKYGMSLGHCMFLEIANKIVINDRSARNYLLEWKSTRSRDELMASNDEDIIPNEHHCENEATEEPSNNRDSVGNSDNSELIQEV